MGNISSPATSQPEFCAQVAPSPVLANLTEEALRRIVAERGYDAAVDLLFDTLRASSPHAEFIRQTESASGNLPAAHRITLAIVPGAFYKQYPQTGADGARFVNLVQSMNIRSQVIPTKSAGTLAQNAGIITNWLAEYRPASDESLILVSFSKGSADIKTALLNPHNHPAFANVHGWLSVGGILHGTPLIAWINARILRHTLIRLYCRFHGIPPRILDEMAHGPGTSLDAPTLLPPNLRLIHLIAFPKRRDLSMPLAERAFDRLLPRGPNDAGGLLLGDLCRFPGIIVPLKGADHYMRNCAALPQLLHRILTSIALASLSER